MANKTSMWADVEGTAVAERERIREESEKKIKELDCQLDELMGGHTVKEKLVRYGFEVEESVSASSNLYGKMQEERKLHSESLSRLSASISEESKVRKEMAQSGLQPIAVIPAKLFEAICLKFGLYRFEHMQEDGSVHISGAKEIVDMFQKMIFISAMIFSLISIGIIGYLFAGSSAWSIPLLGAAGVALHFLCEYIEEGKKKTAVLCGSFLAGFLIAGAERLTHSWNIVILFPAIFGICVINFLILGGMIAAEDKKKWSKSLGDLFYRITIGFGSRSSILRTLWPDKVDSAEGWTVHVRFPQAPTDFLDALNIVRSNAQMRPLFAASPDAISVSRDEVLAAKKQAVAQYDPEPILYVRNGDCVTVISHFGDFPKEKEAVEWVKKEAANICFR